MSWEKVEPGHDLELGRKYRLTLWLRLPDRKEIKDTVRNGILAWDKFFDRLPNGIRVMLGGLDVVQCETGAASENSRTGRMEPWPLRITFIKIGGGTPFLVIAGAVALLLVLLVGAVVVTAKNFERFSQDVREGIHETINPGFILAGLVGIALITGRRR